jgi:hypothetical protein
MKKTVQKFIGDTIRESLKAGTPPSGTLAVSPLNDGLIMVHLESFVIGYFCRGAGGAVRKEQGPHCRPL